MGLNMAVRQIRKQPLLIEEVDAPSSRQWLTRLSTDRSPTALSPTQACDKFIYSHHNIA